MQLKQKLVGNFWHEMYKLEVKDYNQSSKLSEQGTRK